ncbi:hypothetical protein QQ045_027774 [Rhodiola kirilowii]
MRWRKQVLVNTCYITVLLLPVVSSVTGERNSKEANQKLSPELSFQVILHGFLLWASVGFLTPVGILIIRMSSKLESGRKLKILYYLHAVIQISSTVIITAAAALSIKNLDNSFTNFHQRMGLSLYVAVWLQLLAGFFRPKRGTKGRSLWFFTHWALGTFVSLLGIINIYSGLQAYHKRASNSSRLWIILFTTEIAFVAFCYLFQDKWEYIQKQQVIKGGLSTTAISQRFRPDEPKYKPENQP